MNTNNVIPVFFAIDNGYAPYLGVALHSAIRNSTPRRRYKAIILHQELSNENREKLSSLATPWFEVEFIAMKEGLESITDHISNRLRCDYFTLTIYYRLFIPAMFPQYDKALYLDSDIVVPGDLAELFDTEIGDNYIGACPDHSVSEVPELAKYMEEAVGVDRCHYINSGILVMNLKKLREVKLEEHFLSLLNTYHFDCIAPDQDYFNAMCKDRIFFLGEEWDAMPTEGKEPLHNPKIIHFNLFSKPWCYDNTPYEEYFWKYAKDSGYYEDIIQEKENYSDEQKQSDAECLKLLLQRGNSIPDTEITFKKLHDNGVKIRL